jgi:RimJ/RimL family protein N-acetyltransferase
MAPDDEIETDRLLLRPPLMSDFQPLFRLQQDPEMMRYMSDGHIHTRDETSTWLQWNVDLREKDGYSVWAAVLKEEGQFLGWLGVTNPYWFPAMMPTPEIGWFIDRAYWGKGLATEGAKAAVEFAFGQLDIPRLIGIFNADNRASERVMEKIGMTLWREVPHPTFGFPLRVYEIER